MAEHVDPEAFAAVADHIRMIYQADKGGAESLIEAFLEERLKRYSPKERLKCLERVAHHFERLTPETTPDLSLEPKELSQLLALLLGKSIPLGDLSTSELLEKLSVSLNTLFDSVNQIIGVIHANLLGERAELKTIRTVIGAHLGKEGATEPLQNYLDQIQEAFLIAHQAFQQAAYRKVRQILQELDPDRISDLSEGGLKFGPLRKAELYEIYQEKFRTCRQWFESDRFMSEFLREFESICIKMYKKDATGA